MVKDDISRVNEGANVSCALSKIWRVGTFGIGVKQMMYERIVVPTVTYRAEAWWVREGVKKRLNVFEMLQRPKGEWCNVHTNSFNAGRLFEMLLRSKEKK